MTQEQFSTLSQDLRTIVPKIPLNWGHIQNNGYDSELKRYCNIFAIMSLAELQRHISRFDVEHQNYYLRRWYLLRCADCDEYLFYINPNIEHNPDRYDKEWDIKINNHILFDVKGTVIPKSMRDDVNGVLETPEDIVKFYYDNQSRGVRYDMQNRLFVVHHSLVDQGREFYLRCAWKAKQAIYHRFAEEAESIHYLEYEGCRAAVIYIIETEKNKLEYKIAGLDNTLKPIDAAPINTGQS